MSRFTKVVILSSYTQEAGRRSDSEVKKHLSEVSQTCAIYCTKIKTGPEFSWKINNFPGKIIKIWCYMSPIVRN